jgi:hypothetical protein
MKKLIILSTLLFSMLGSKLQAQETFGNDLNLGFGIGYYGYIGHSLPVVHLNYEFEVARNFTLAPFITFYTYREYVYWGDPFTPYRDYYYRETVIPIGVKGIYYFDELLGAGEKWDFYLGASLGFAIRTIRWEDGYYGDTDITRASPLYLDGHIGTRLHLNDNLALFLDLSSGVSTIGLTF